MRERYGVEPKRLLATFSAARQTDFCADVRRVHLGKAPMICTVAQGYGRNVAEAWIEIHLMDLSEFAGCREKLRDNHFAEVSKMVLQRYGDYKLTEFMLFFQNFKAGEYGHFYGAVDPIVIMEALAEFNRERNRRLLRYQQEQEAAARLESEAQFREMKARYQRRIPNAWTVAAPIDFLQYRLMGYDSMSDEALAEEIAEITAGRKRLPVDVADMLKTIKNSFNL